MKLETSILIYNEHGKRKDHYLANKHDILDYAGIGTELVKAPFADGYFYPMDMMLGVLNALGREYIKADFEIDEVGEAYANYHPGRMTI